MKFIEFQCARCKTKTFWTYEYKADIILICTACSRIKVIEREK